MINPSLAFTPAEVISDPERFAGRQRELDELADALEIAGGHIMIYGNRGIGKSSLAQQLMLMSQGHATLVERLSNIPLTNFDFLPVYLQCDDSIKNIDGLLIRLLTTQSGLSDWIPYQIRQVEGSSGLGGSLTLQVLKLDGKLDTKIVETAPELTTDIRSVFANALYTLATSGAASSGVLIVIDEFDRVADKTGLASLLKSLNPKIKVVLVGVSTNVTDLIGDHESVARQFTGGCLKVDVMSDAEIGELFDRAETVLEQQITFPRPTRVHIAQLAKGHPFLVHLLGRSATISALRQGRKSVEIEVVNSSLTEIALKGTAPIQESTYKGAVANSFTRETVLKEFASVGDEEIYTTPVYKRISERLGMQDPNAISVYMGHLTSDKYGKVLMRTRDRYYRFTDSLFKAYASSRPFLHASSVVEWED